MLINITSCRQLHILATQCVGFVEMMSCYKRHMQFGMHFALHCFALHCNLECTLWFEHLRGGRVFQIALVQVWTGCHNRIGDVDSSQNQFFAKTKAHAEALCFEHLHKNMSYYKR